MRYLVWLLFPFEGLEKQYIDETMKYFDQLNLTLDDYNGIRKEFFEKCRKD